ncbi:MAG: bifunctional hydroxymethylpyrimidine kinase/phosphomethylpyrimidine kinase [Chloroflexi bacterium]|nr:bifunctional hydroxymethylpyrimidine kinase/phosphomethylpyrimidine kinase [Chloroflexota bacterium]
MLGSIGETCAAMTPCMRLHAYLGRSLAASGAVTKRNPYAECVRTYAVPEFEAVAAQLEGLLERYASDTSDVRLAYRIGAQIDAIVDDIGVDAAKTGMLSSAEIIAAVAERIGYWRLERLVVDPVMVAKSGDRLLRADAVQALIRDLLPLALVLTPNLPEAEVLVGRTLETEDEIRQAALDILALGPRAVVMKGGHRAGDATDLLFDGQRFRTFAAERIDTANTHGTGCTFSAAIAAGLADGLDVVDAVGRAKHYVTEAIRRARPLGGGHGPVAHDWVLSREALGV